MEEFIQEVTKKAGAMAMEYFGKVGVKYSKTNALDVVTEADLAISNFVIAEIKKKYPDHAIISEEEEAKLGESDYVWIIDPIDGTLNFSRGTPLFGVMIALMHKDELDLGCVILPALNEFYFAQKGKGAYFNGEKMACSTHPTLIDSYGATGRNYGSGKGLLQKLEQAAQENFTYTKLLASAVAKSWVARGARDWYFGNGGGVWDYAPVVLFLQESGCTVTNYKGEPWKITDTELVAANPTLHAAIMKIFQS